MVFFPLFDHEILELNGTTNKFTKERLVAALEEDLYLLLSVLPTDEVVVISPSFLFENVICEEVLTKNIELLEECLVTILMKENNFDEFNCKKQERYLRVAGYAKYEEAYYKNRLKQLANIPFVRENKTIPIGTTSFSICIALLEKEREHYGIPSQVFDEIICRLKETETTSFLWESVYEQIEKAKVPDHIVRKLQVRTIMSQSYLGAYQKEGIILANDRLLNNINFGGTHNYDLIKIKKIISALEIAVPLKTMSCKAFCSLKKNADYILAIKKVHELIQSGKTIEDILQELRLEKIDQELQSILKCVCFVGEKGQDMAVEKNEQKNVDVLIMLATNEEERAITGKGGWNREKIPSGEEYFTQEKNGIHFAIARGYDMGETDAVIMAQKFIDPLKPKVIAMAGFCAGRKGKVHLGDIIVANKVYNYDVGKQLSETDSLPEISNFSLKGEWLQFIERLDEKWIKEWIGDVTIQPPKDFQWQKIELLNTLREKSSTVVGELYDSNKYPDWKEVIEELQKEQYISMADMGLKLTTKGKTYINEYMIKNIVNAAPEPKLYTGPIATGTKVQVWSEIFNVLERKHDRKTCAVDMEAHAIGKSSIYNAIPFIVVKGVGDFADDGKAFANRYIEYASRASCQFIISLFSMDEFMVYWKKGN